MKKIKKITSLGIATVLSLSTIVYGDNIKKDDLSKVSIETKIVEGISVDYNSIDRKTNDLNIKANIPVISGLSSKEYQEKINKEVFNGINKAINEFESEGKGLKGELKIDSHVKSKDKTISIIVEEYKIFSTMANGESNINIYNIDTVNNKEIELKDLFAKNFNYIDKINTKIKDIIAKNKELYFENENGFNTITKDQKFYIDGEDIVIVFDKGSIAPNSTGIVEFKINKNEIDKEIKRDYINEKYNFIFKLAPIWGEDVIIEENKSPEKGLFQLDFIYKPLEKDIKEQKFFSIRVRDLKDNIDKGEYLLKENNYKYTTLISDKNIYKEGTKDDIRFNEIIRVLDGVDDLFLLNSNKEINVLDKIILNNKEVNLKNKIIIKDNKVNLPFREIAENLDFNVEWNNKERLATMERLPVTAGVYVNTNKYSFAKSLVELEDMGVLINGNTYVPVKFYSDVLKGNIEINNGILEINY